MAKLDPWPVRKDNPDVIDTLVPILPPSRMGLIDDKGNMTKEWYNYFTRLDTFFKYIVKREIETIDKVNPVLPP